MNSSAHCLLPVSLALTFAYIGPGAGLSAIGAFLAVVAGVFVAILGFLWYPIKRLFGKKRSDVEDGALEDE